MMSFKSLALLLGLVGAFFLLSPASHAQAKGKKKGAKKAAVEKKDEAAAPEASKDPKDLAKVAYKKGKELYDKGDYQASLDSFMAAYNYVPNPFVYISIAQCYDKLGKCQEARDYYLKYAKEKPDAGNIPDIKEKVAELEARKGKVMITSDPDGATITLDGETTELVTPADIELGGGDHALALNKDGYIMETQAFTVPICGEVEIDVTLKSAGAVEVEGTEDIDKAIEDVTKQGKKEKFKVRFGPAHYVAFSLAGAAAITAAVTGGLALQKSNDFDDKKKAWKDNPSHDNYEKLDDIRSQGRPLAIVCDVTIGVAAVAAVTGIALLFIGPKESKQATVSPIITPAGGGAALNVSF
jgi:tetratricopeptide (TPR) repeat protein